MYGFYELSYLLVGSMCCVSIYFNTLRPSQVGRHFPDAIFKCIFLNENVWISIKISRNFVPKGPINNISALVQIMAWRRPGDKPWSEPMMVEYASLGLNELRKRYGAKERFAELHALHITRHDITCYILHNNYSQQQVNIGLNNVWLLNRRRTIIWTSDGIIHWRIYTAPLGHDKLIVLYMLLRGLVYKSNS